jgi:hypothetical protein
VREVRRISVGLSPWRRDADGLEWTAQWLHRHDDYPKGHPATDPDDPDVVAFQG